MNNYIRNPISYSGNKYRLLEHIIPKLGKGDTLLEPFAGSCVVGVNSDYDNLILNDINKPLMETMKYLYENSLSNTIINMYRIKRKYELYHNNEDSSEGYYRLREDYNKTKEPLMLLALSFTSISALIRFNNKGEFNASFSKGHNKFTKDKMVKLKNFIIKMKTKNITFSTEDFRDLDFNDKTVYIDSPYLITAAQYNNTWKEDEEIDLYSKLDSSKCSFLLSNTTKAKGENNEILIDWMQKYNVEHLDRQYNSWNASRKSSTTGYDEVLINNKKEEYNE